MAHFLKKISLPSEFTDQSFTTNLHYKTDFNGLLRYWKTE